MECDRLLLGSNGRNGQEPVIAKITLVGPYFITFATPVNFVILLIKNIEFAFFSTRYKKRTESSLILLVAPKIAKLGGEQYV